MAKPALGRGLSGMLGGNSPASRPASSAAGTVSANGGAVVSPHSVVAVGDAIQRVAIQQIRPCPFQPRKDFGEEALQELADSIRSQGVIQPLIVRRQADHFEIIAGERRWRAAQLAGLTELPIILREADDRAVLELALIENLQRENLNPIEEALGFSELIEKFQLRQEDAAVKVGRSRASVANALRLLKLPASIQAQLREGKLSTGHAKVLLGLPSSALQEKAAARVLERGLSVRQTEELVAHLQEIPAQSPRSASEPLAPPRDPNLAALENRLRERLGTKVQLRYAKGKGSVEIKFFSDEDLQRVLDLLGIRMD